MARWALSEAAMPINALRWWITVPWSAGQFGFPSKAASLGLPKSAHLQGVTSLGKVKPIRWTFLNKQTPHENQKNSCLGHLPFVACAYAAYEICWIQVPAFTGGRPSTNPNNANPNRRDLRPGCTCRAAWLIWMRLSMCHRGGTQLPEAFDELFWNSVP